MFKPFSHLARIACIAILTGAALPSPAGVEGNPGNFVRAIWLVQRYGIPDAAAPANDVKLKGRLFKALGKKGILNAISLEGLMTPQTFAQLAGPDGQITPAQIEQALAQNLPTSRRQLFPKIVAYAEELSTSLDMIGERHRAASTELAAWLAQRYKPGKPLAVICICTGNSRRSILGAVLGNIAADFYGLPEIKFYSGGTAPSAFNTRTVAALKEIGVEIEDTGKEAKHGEPATANPIYQVRWGTSLSAGDPSPEMREFSKLYSDPANPQKDFAALMVCGDADESCPIVSGAALRISMPYLDPKVYDGSAYEAAKYRERRDDIGRLMLAALMQTRLQLQSTGKLSSHP